MVSVLIPVYNGEKYLKEAINSVLSQTYFNYEIIVIDDGSTDKTAEIVQSFVNVRYIHQKHHGVSVSRNRGVREAKGSIISFLDVDDVFEKTKLEKQVAHLEQNKDCIICYTNITNFTEINDADLTDRQKQIMKAHVENILPSACIRRSVFEKCGYFDTNLQYGEDTEWTCRVKQMNIGQIHTLNETLYYRRIHNNNLSLTHEYHGNFTLKPIIAQSTINYLTMKKGRKVSVVIPAYNAEKYIDETIESVYIQNWLGEIELIVIDNGSTDNTLEIVKKYNCIVLNEPQKGAAFARNKGILKATGDYIFMLDADDYLCDCAGEVLFKAIFSANKYDCVFGKTIDFISPELSNDEKNKLVARKEPYNGILPGSSLIRKTVFEKVGLFDTSLSSGETIDWMIRMKKLNIPFVQIDDVVLNRRLHNTNTGVISQEDERKNYAAILRRKLKETNK